MSWQEIKEAIDNNGRAFDEFKKANDERIEAIKSGNESLAAELNAKVEKIEKSITDGAKLKKDLEIELEHQRDRIEELESRSKEPGKTGAQKRAEEYKETFIAWIRDRGQSPANEQKMQDIARKALEQKDVTIGTSASGGYAVPEEIARQIEKLEQKFSPVRRLVKVVQAGTSDYKELVGVPGATSGWVGESGSRTKTDTPTLREVAPTFGELYAYPQVSEWSLDDIFFNVENWLSMAVADEFAIQEGSAVLTGNGSSKPTGMFNTAPVTTADTASPLRAAAAYQYVASAASPDAILPDSLIDLTYTLNSRYRANSTWVMNSNTTAAIRKLKDDNKQYLWQPGLQAGEPDRLLGYRHETWEQMDDVGSNKLPVAFGDFARAYLLADRVGMRVTRDNVTNVGFVKFYVRRREGGIVLNNDALKVLKTT